MTGALWFVSGLMVGIMVGFLIAGLCVAAGRNEK